MIKKNVRHVGDVWLDDAGNECTLRPNGTIGVKTLNNDPSLTIQSEKDSCDFNLIYAKYVKTGRMSNIRTDEPRYGDFSSAVDFHDCVLRLQNAEEEFMRLPAALRSYFSNDPGKLIDFLADEGNRAEAQKLGLIAAPLVTDEPEVQTPPPSAEGG